MVRRNRECTWWTQVRENWLFEPVRKLSASSPGLKHNPDNPDITTSIQLQYLLLFNLSSPSSHSNRSGRFCSRPTYGSLIGNNTRDTLYQIIDLIWAAACKKDKWTDEKEGRRRKRLRWRRKKSEEYVGSWMGGHTQLPGGAPREDIRVRTRWSFDKRIYTVLK